MNRLYGELRNRFISEGISSLIYNNHYFREYTKKFTEEETYQILSYSQQDFKNYVKFIDTLNRQQKLRQNEEIVRRISNIIFNSQNGDSNSLSEIILETNIINNPGIIEFSNRFINISNKSKTKVIKNIILNNELYSYRKSALLNLTTYVQYMENDRQFTTLEDLLNIPSIYSHPSFIKFINIIRNNPNNKYLEDIPVILEDSTLYFHKDILYFIDAVLHLKNDYQESLLFEILYNNSMINSNVCYETIEFVLNPNNDYKFKFLKYLINNKKFISDNRFGKLLNLYKEINDVYKIRALTDIIHSKRGMDILKLDALNDYVFDLLTSTIKKCKKEFQVNEIMEIFYNVNSETLNNHHILTFFEGIVNSKHRYQAKAISFILIGTKENDILNDSLLQNEISSSNTFFLNHLYNIINLINNTENKKFCISIYNVLKVPGLLIRRDCMNILKKYATLKTENQMNTFYHILYKPGFLEQNNFQILDYVRVANDNNLQVEAIDIVMDETNLYKDEKGIKLIKYLLISKNRKIINFITAILLRINILGYEKAEEFINLVLENSKDIDNIIQTNSNSGTFPFLLVNTYNQLDESNEKLIDKTVKIIKKKF